MIVRRALLCGIIAALLFWTVALAAEPLPPPGQPPGPFQPHDCADRLMDATGHASAASIHEAYVCLDPILSGRATEDQVLQAYQSLPDATRIERVGSASKLDGNVMVFYALDQADRTVWYVVTINPQGAVIHVE